ncbi:hypothetical protein K227x_57260 [Rubripirellula lacrimiformis]|uniref:Uncharacterized protein n=1 Tax=Rubripirellula lacrimiformis TaxID=1930273 RepID=A0A517NJJ0_9BACT|nr:serine kinase [Rubripirellula lacrimiformis]QDT07299.1 hypothetical protein K227x_57260 [Rubripirellula lacrimiformis]
MSTTTTPQSSQAALKPQFDLAAQRDGLTEKRLSIAGRTVCFKFAGQPLLRRFMPALAHHPNSDAAAELTIHLWDSVTPPVQQSLQEWIGLQPVILADQQSGWSLVEPGIGLFSQLTTDGNAFVCCRDGNQLPVWESAVPLRSLLNAWAAPQGGVVHGAAVGNDRGAVLLAGVGGSGKSSTALTCLAEPDLRHLGDDLVLITNETQPMVNSLYNSAKLLPENTNRFSDLSLSVNPELPRNPEKETYFLFPPYADKLAAQRPLTAILLPRVGGDTQTRLSPASQAEAWHAIVPVTLTLLGGSRPENLSAIVDIIRRVPIHHLILGSDRKGIAPVIRRVLDEGLDA